MDWFTIVRGSEVCSTDGCLNPADWRMEAEGVGANYCVNCRARVMQLNVVRENPEDFAEPYYEPQSGEGRR